MKLISNTLKNLQIIKQAKIIALLATLFITPSALSAVLSPLEGVLLTVGQDVDSINNYHDDVGIKAGGVTNYIGITSLNGLTNNADSGAGRNNVQELATTYPESALVIGVSMNGVISEVAAGNYNDNIDILLTTLATYNRPVYLRWAYEIDGPWNNHNTVDIITTFRYVHQRISDLGYEGNIALVWQLSSYCPNASGQARLESYWPGDEYVDWVGLSWFAPQDCDYSRVNEAALFAKNHNKPLFINEASPQRYSIGNLTYSSNVGNGGNKVIKTAVEIWDEWYQPFFDFINAAENNVKAITYINANWNAQTRWNPTDGIGSPEGYWGDSRVQANDIIKQRWLDATNISLFHQQKADLFDLLGFVKSNNNQAPKVSLSVPVELQLNGASVVVTAIASDNDDSVSEVSLYQTNSGAEEQLISTLNQAPFSWTLENTVSGLHELRVVASDSQGAMSSDSDSFYVQTQNENILRIEAEQSEINGSAEIYNDTAASKGSGIGFISTIGAGFRIDNVPASSELIIRYASDFSGTISLSINGSKQALTFFQTGAWVGNYSTLTLASSISDNSTIELEFDNASSAMNVDYIQFFTNDVMPEPEPEPEPEPLVQPNVTGSSESGGGSAAWVLILLFVGLTRKRG